VTGRLSAEETTALLHEVPAAYQTQITDVLLTALAQTLTHWTGNAVRIELEGHGREDLFAEVDLARTVGWFTTLYPVVLEVDLWAGPGEQLKAIKEQVRQIPQRGIGYGLLRYLNESQDTAPLRAMPPAQINFNYLGQLDRGTPTDGLLKPAPGSTGQSQSPDNPRRYLIEITGSVYEGILQFSWSYSEELHQRATIERLAQEYIAALRALIEHCLSPDAGGFTPSDFPLAQLDQYTLDKLSSLLDDVDTSEELPV
ncbi:MAG TPA: condensation domain-containing protein, partial [Herpetosiphonaceae bacterium]